MATVTMTNFTRSVHAPLQSEMVSREKLFMKVVKCSKIILAKEPSLYDDGRSDDKGVEPESVTTGKIGPRTLAFVALERADALVIVDVTHPSSPIFLQVLHTGDAPEGVLFIPKHESPINKSLVVTSCEGDGTVQVFALTGEETDF